MLTGTALTDRGYCMFSDSNDNTVITGGEYNRLNVFSFASDGQRNWTSDPGDMPGTNPYVEGTIQTCSDYDKI